ncbi:JM148 [macacine gammaherpesvirus 11]|uniref:JM148 n=2 Tax=macacine gammaherpesvirus 11 TaxID=2560570 RepID=G9JMX5_9GAMA|nr:JM148 [Macaca fuscata rhadinovirus]AAT00125.1 JM148 [Macaca fuscata rhadinovirus]AEW87672.1 JM148 [Macaca fuscata rhadinovirus]AEW87842.1 JM148 [Macaca fuscata rhadinovirus]
MTPAPKSGRWVRAATIKTCFGDPRLTPRPKLRAHGGAGAPPSPFPTARLWAPNRPMVICFCDPRVTRSDILRSMVLNSPHEYMFR